MTAFEQFQNLKFDKSLLAETFRLTPMEDPFGSCRALQAGFDGSRIVYSDSYYDVLGIERE